MFAHTTWQRRLVRDFTTAWRRCAAEDTDAGVRGDPERSRNARAVLVHHGWHDLLVSADEGGLGLGGTEAALLAESLGRALLPAEAMDPVPAAPALARWGLPGGSGADRARVTLCPPTHPRVTREDGTSAYLAHAVPDLLLVPDGPNAVRPIEGADLLAEELVGPDGRLWAISARPAPMAGPLDAGTLWATAVLLRCAHLLGVGATALDAGIERARERRQFGRTIGSYQAVAIPLAAHRARQEALRLAIGEELLCLAADPGAAEGVLARAEAIFAALRPLVEACVSHGSQVHGAAGLAWDGVAARCRRRLLAETAGEAGYTRHDGHPYAPPSRRPRVIGPPAPADVVAVARRRVPRVVEDTAVDRPDDVCVHELFERTAARHPDRIALRFGSTTLTYRELDRRADRLAHVLRDHGVGPDDPVGICMDRGVDAIVAILAVLKAGGAYVPIDPEYPAVRVEFLIRDSAAVLLLTHEWTGEWLPETDVPILFVDTIADRIEQAPSTPVGASVVADGLAYLIYTSGSTGTPKGVEIEHRGLVNRLLWDASVFPSTDADTILQHTSLGFDISVWEIFAPLTSGACLVVAPRKATRDPHALLAESAATGVTVLACVPSLLDVLIEEREPSLAELPDLRRVFCGGEVLSPQLCARFHAAAPGVELHNFYGPSECTIDVTHWRLDPRDVEASVPIGRPIDNVRVHVLDEFGTPVPLGFPGELHVAGAGVARGYRSRPGLTAARFVPDPFTPRPGGRLYRTGDIVTRARDGALYFRGRSDHQVKVRGHRIEPGEIEAALEAHPDVHTAVLHVLEGRIEAHVLPAPDAGFDEQRLRAHLRERLPAHMVPSGIGTLAAVPLDANGKIDRRALPSLAARGGGTVAEVAGDATERALLALAGQVLGVDRLAPGDDFFATGGSSLDAARFVARVRRELGVELDLEAFFAAPTIAAATAGAAGSAAERASTTPDTTREDTDG
ncbi:amino acid adenylation domain-containing protein [Embleya sp. NPDC056575]|uniref:amino acid adenylation domain-containing protein n=1 Tax=unclassified Embleya TaxID=2699296 RepID=UPI0036B07D49